MQSIVVKHLSRVLSGNTDVISIHKLFHNQTFRTLHLSSVFNMSVKQGDKIPSVDLYERTPAEKVNLAEASANKKVVVFGVPGAFTPGCSKTHLPGYIENAEAFKSKGISEIFCISVNDPFVMAAWGDAQKAEGKVRMLADPTGEFTKQLGFQQDIPVLGGLRSKRFSMIINNGSIEKVNVEPDGTGLSCSLATNLALE